MVVGILVIVGSVAGVSAVMAAADRTTAIYVTAGPLATGDALTESSLRIARVNLGTTTEHYLRPGDEITGQIAQHPIAEGELVSRSAVSDVIADGTVTTVIGISGPLPASTKQGSLVDVWAAPNGSVRLEQAAAPTVVVSNAEVVRITMPEGIAAGNTTNVELRLPRGKLQAVLASTALGLSFTVVTVGAR